MVQDPDSKLRCLIVLVSDVSYALDTRAVRRTVAARPPLPASLEVLGRDCTLLDLRLVLGSGPPQLGEVRLVVAESAGRWAGLAVDAIAGVEEFEAGAVLALPWSFRGRERAWFPRLLAGPAAGALVPLLDVDALLATAAAAGVSPG